VKFKEIYPKKVLKQWDALSLSLFDFALEHTLRNAKVI
jgi:hypothetical protein